MFVSTSKARKFILLFLFILTDSISSSAAQSFNSDNSNDTHSADSKNELNDENRDKNEKYTIGRVHLPDDLKPFGFQLAGHVFQKGGNEQLGVLVDLEGNLWKPHPTTREIEFYETVLASEDHILREVRQFIPTYLGTETRKIDGEDIKFMRVGNILKGFELPCSLDVKIGRIRRPPGEVQPEDQKKRYIAMLKKFGFGIPGFEYYNLKDGTFVKEGKEEGYVMTPRRGIQTIYNFMNGEIGFRCGLVNVMLMKLQKIEDWFQRQRHFRFFDSSVFLTYDTKTLANFVEQMDSLKIDEEGVKKQCRKLDLKIDVHLLDFGKVIRSSEDEVDENYYFGLKNLILILKNLLNLDENIREIIFNKEN